jgi:RNA polymerase sigma-70 factor (ECF subfamily)
MTKAQHLSSSQDTGTGDNPLVETFHSFYVREFRSVLALANVLVADHQVAEDLTQEAFMAALGVWPNLDQPGHWIRSVVSNRAKSWWRRVYAARRANLKLYEPSGGIVDMPGDSEEFWSEVRSLPTRQAQAVTLHYLEERSTEEIADILGCEQSTVRVHLSRRRKALASRLQVEL